MDPPIDRVEKPCTGPKSPLSMSVASDLPFQSHLGLGFAGFH